MANRKPNRVCKGRSLAVYGRGRSRAALATVWFLLQVVFLCGSAAAADVPEENLAEPQDAAAPQRLPAIDWDREAEAMVKKHLDTNAWTQQKFATFQPPQGSNSVQSGTKRPQMTPSASVGTGSVGPIGTGPAWLGEMAPFVLEGDREGVGFNGILEVDGIYDSNAVGLVPSEGVLREFVTSQIPVVGTPASFIYPQEVISPNQTQLGVWFEQPTDLARFRAYALMNLFGDDTAVEFQVYKVYANYGWFKAGKDYSIFFNQSAAPDTIDFEGPNAIPYVRFPQLVLNIPLSELGFAPHQGIVLGIEHAPGEFTLLNGSNNALMPWTDANNLWGSNETMPSIVGKYVLTPEGAHFEAAAVLRRLTAVGAGVDPGNTGKPYRSTTYGYGGAVSGKFSTWGQNNVILAAQGGRGIAAYSQDTSHMGLDAAPSVFVYDPPKPGKFGFETRGPLRAIPIAGCWAAYQHFWTETIRSTATFSILTLNDNWVDTKLTPTIDAMSPANSYTYGRLKQARYASVNLIWSPNPSFTVGIEYMYGHRIITAGGIGDPNQQVPGRKGQANRFQACVRWNFDHKTPFRN